MLFLSLFRYPCFIHIRFYLHFKGETKEFEVSDIKMRAYRLIAFVSGETYAMEQSLLEKLIVSKLVRKFPHFMEPGGSLPHSQQPATCPYHEPAQSSPGPHPTS
jgi:hypothetical protein